MRAFNSECHVTTCGVVKRRLDVQVDENVENSDGRTNVDDGCGKVRLGAAAEEIEILGVPEKGDEKEASKSFVERNHLRSASRFDLTNKIKGTILFMLETIRSMQSITYFF